MAPSFPILRENIEPLTVSELTARIKENLETAFPDVYVVGELSRTTRASSGHWYLTLKDENAVLSAVIWRNTAAGIRFEPEEGLEVIAHGGIDVYAPRGGYQLIIKWMEPRGVGALQLAFQQLRERLEKEGLFRPEAKKPLPPFPRRIGVVTSPTGAAVRDIINVISRRYPLVEILLYPVRVQGDMAAPEIAMALDALNHRRPDLDLIIVGRGGGSMEDLWAFNEEAVARAIHRSRIPIVSAVGHEIDISISDLVADVRAATPTEAGEIVVPDRADLLQRLAQSRRRLAVALQRMVLRGRERLEAAASRYVFRHPESILRERAQRADECVERMKGLMDHRLKLTAETLSGAGSRLEALSPLKVLARGYSVTLGPAGTALRSVADVAAGDRIRTRLQRGELTSQVTDVHEDAQPDADQA
jgi:exodeoxyribonuclease VII large subunit